VRVGIVILPEARWSTAAVWWRDAELMGFDQAWTYDHLGWRSLVDHPWFDAMATLATAATVTDRIRLGTLVSSPNTRRAPSFVREITTVDDVSAGRLTIGLGSGGLGNYDNTVFGGPEITTADRTSQFEEFVEGLDRLLTNDRATLDGDHVRAIDARSTPGCVQTPRVPFVIGALGPKAMRLAAQYGSAWVTTGRPAETDNEYWQGVKKLSERFSEIDETTDGSTDRMLLLDAAGPTFSLESVGVFEDQLGRAKDLGFTDVVTHRPRKNGVYAGKTEVLEQVASTVLPTV
jgi:alkanesulfonate monooxygenase SsuD/methylene tetrahydromethanopterin reductase-like flavin-dependent oxidoreductase (luciferase family)